METVGKSVIKLDFAKGFTAQFATALSVSGGSIIGLPLSTTHCMVGSLMGLIIALKLSNSVRKVYPPEKDESEDNINQAEREPLLGGNQGFAVNDEQNDDTFKNATTVTVAIEKKNESGKKAKVIIKIVAWWVATVPVALLVSFTITKMIV